MSVSLYPPDIERWRAGRLPSAGRDLEERLHALERTLDLFHDHTHPKLVHGDPVDIFLDEGADRTGVKNADAAILRAIARAEADDRPLYIHPGTYLISGSGSEIFRFTRPIPVYGAGPWSQLLVATGTPTTRDVIAYDPADLGASAAFPLFSRFLIKGQSAGVGRYGIHLKPTGTSEVIARWGIESIWTINLGSFAVYADGSVAGATGVFTGWIRDCNFNGDGFGATDLLDSVLIDNSVFLGSGYAIDVDFKSSVPGKFIVRSCNVTASKGVRIGGPQNSTLLAGNYFEPLSTFAGADNAYVNLTGNSSWPTRVPVVRDNIFAIFSGLAGTPDALRIDYAEDALIDGNYFFWDDAATDPITLTANSKRARVTRGNAFFGPTVGARRWLDQGVQSQGDAGVLYATRTDSSAVANTTTHTAFGGAYVYTIKANTLRVGQAIRARLSVRFSCTGTPTLSGRIMVNGTSGSIGGGVAITCSSGATDFQLYVDILLIVKAVGTSGTLSRSTAASNTANAADITVNTEADITLDPSCIWGTADAANTAKAHQFTVELLDSVATA